jgi:hypothetical protein
LGRSRKSHIISVLRADLAVWLAVLVCSLYPPVRLIASLTVRLDPDFFPGMTCLNVRMLDGVDLKALKIKFADGKSYTPGELAEGEENKDWKKVGKESE